MQLIYNLKMLTVLALLETAQLIAYYYEHFMPCFQSCSMSYLSAFRTYKNLCYSFFLETYSSAYIQIGFTADKVYS